MLDITREKVDISNITMIKTTIFFTNQNEGEEYLVEDKKELKSWTLDELHDFFSNNDIYITTVYGECMLLDYNAGAVYITDLIDIWYNYDSNYNYIQSFIDEMVVNGKVVLYGNIDNFTEISEEVFQLENK